MYIFIYILLQTAVQSKAANGCLFFLPGAAYSKHEQVSGRIDAASGSCQLWGTLLPTLVWRSCRNQGSNIN